MNHLQDQIRTIHDVTVTREIASGSPNSRWFGGEFAEVMERRGHPLLGLLVFAMILSTEWEVSKIVAVAFWFLVVLFVVGVVTVVAIDFFDFLQTKFMGSPVLRKLTFYGFTGWVVFHLIRFHF
jgi:hypothetical protein